MNDQTKNGCRCEKTGCDCAEVRVEPCRCGERCGCEKRCRCGAGCACSSAAK